jgi:hypothetical protein
MVLSLGRPDPDLNPPKFVVLTVSHRPLIGGFTTQEKGWRWANWVVMIGGGAAFLMMVIIPETYKPTLLQKMAAKKRKETGDDSYWSRYDVRVGFGELMRVNLSRPFVMAVKEPICIFWNVYIAIIYGESLHVPSDTSPRLCGPTARSPH